MPGPDIQELLLPDPHLFLQLYLKLLRRHDLWRSPSHRRRAAIQRPASRPPPSEQDLLLAGEGCPLLACGTPLISQLSSGLPGPSFPDGQPRWAVSSGPPHPPVSHITLAQESSLPFELPRPDSEKSRKNSWLSQKHVEEGNHEQSKVFPPACRQKNVPRSDVQRAVRGSDERAHTLWEACALGLQGQVCGRSKVPESLGSMGSLSRRDEAVPGKQEGPKEQKWPHGI